MYAFLVSCHNCGSDEASLPLECRTLVWRCLSLPEQMWSSTVCAQSRQGAPAVVRLAAATQRFDLAASAGSDESPATRELSGIVELVTAERRQLWSQLPAVTALLADLLRSQRACEATRRCAVECLAQLLGSARRAIELFACYDCNVQCPAVLEPALEALAWAASKSALREAALEALVGIARSISAGIRDVGAAASAPGSAAGAGGPWAEAWAERKRQRAQAKERAAAFNRDPAGWWQAKSSGSDSQAPHRAAEFLLEHKVLLDRSKVGTFIGRHADVMLAFVQQFDLRGLEIVPAFTRVLSGFELPGEAQLIDRFCECFGAAWGSANDVDPDAAYIFAFSLVMLGTDLHRPASAGHERMTFEQFAKNLSGALPKGSIPETMIRNTYDQLRAGALQGGSKPDEEGPSEVCARLRETLRRRTSEVHEARLLNGNLPAEDLVGLWQALWSVAWGPLLGAFSAGAHAAGPDDELCELALRGLQLGCEAAALLGEGEQAMAFSAALMQLAS